MNRFIIIFLSACCIFAQGNSEENKVKFELKHSKLEQHLQDASNKNFMLCCVKPADYPLESVFFLFYDDRSKLFCGYRVYFWDKKIWTKCGPDFRRILHKHIPVPLECAEVVFAEWHLTTDNYDTEIFD